MGKPWQGYDPTSMGRHWAVPAKLLREVMGCEPHESMSLARQAAILDERVHSLAAKDAEDRWTRIVKRYLGEVRGSRTCGRILTHQLASRRTIWATPRKNRKHCWNASSRPAATKATWCSIRSAAAARPSPSRKG